MTTSYRSREPRLHCGGTCARIDLLGNFRRSPYSIHRLPSNALTRPIIYGKHGISVPHFLILIPRAALCHPQIQVSPSLDHRVEQHQYDIDWCQEYGPSTTLAAYIRPSHKSQVNQTSSALATNWMHHPPFQNHPSSHMSLRRGPVALVGSNFLVNITELISPPRQLIRTDESQFLLRLNMNASSKSSLYVIPS
jgi:hypothetical protein